MVGKKKLMEKILREEENGRLERISFLGQVYLVSRTISESAVFVSSERRNGGAHRNGRGNGWNPFS